MSLPHAADCNRQVLFGDDLSRDRLLKATGLGAFGDQTGPGLRIDVSG